VSVISFTILGEICSMKNSRQIVTMGGKPGMIKSQAARDYERNALLQIPPLARKQLTGPVKITIRAYYASERKDLDCALLLDCLQNRYKKMKGKLIKTGEGQYAYGPSERVLVQKGVVVNDRQFRHQTFIWALDPASPRCEVEIDPLEMQQGVLIGDELPADEPDDDGDSPPF